MTSTVSTTNYTGYDSMGRVTASSQSTNGLTYPFAYGYNLAGEMTSETYPSGRIISTGYDVAGRVNTVNGQKTGEANKSYAALPNNWPHGAAQTMNLGNGLVQSASYNNRLQPTSIGLGTLATFGYTYGTTNNNGNVQSQTIAAPGGWSVTQQYGYDKLNRLTSASETYNSSTMWTEGFDYDRYGNRTTATTSSQLLNTYSPAQTFNASTNRISDTNFNYDVAGNLTQARSAPGAANRSFSYDAESRLVAFNGATATYSYDGDGRRVMKVIGSSTTVFVYDATGKLIAEYSNTAATGSGTTFLTADHLGSTRVVTDASGAVLARHDYLAFGGEIDTTFSNRNTIPGYVNSDDTAQQFTGQERDSESGLDHFGARYYSSTRGEFSTPDPAGLLVADPLSPQSWNQYAYVLNNPLRYVDPSGLECVWDDGSYDSADDPDTGTQASCEHLGSTWVDHSFFQGNNLPDWSPGANSDIANLTVLLQQLQALLASNGTKSESRLDCIKRLSNAGSVQNAVGLGNSKNWFASALLGNNVASGIGLLQALPGFRGTANGLGQTYGSNVAAAAAQGVAQRVPNLALTTTTVAQTSISTASVSVTVTAVSQTTTNLAFGSAAKAVAGTVAGLFTGKTYFDIGIAVLADALCLADGY